LKRFHHMARQVFAAPPSLAFLPAICLAAFWFGGEGALLTVAVIMPLIFLISGQTGADKSLPSDTITSLFDRAVFDDLLNKSYTNASETGRQTAVFIVTIDDFDPLVERYGTAAADAVLRATGERLVSTMRAGDHVGRMDGAAFAICVAPVQQLDLETCIQLSGRMQAAIEDPISVDGLGIYVSASIGFCQNTRAPGHSSADWFKAATVALDDAKQHGPSAIRAYSEQMQRQTSTKSALREEVGHALDNGQIQPWFQPQVSTDTGTISGFEALARWSHPVRGMISPADFLPAIEQAGLLERLAEVIMYQSFSAIKAWDDANLNIPQIGVNFAGTELSNPRLLEKIQWELDRFELTPDRLAVEVLETVVASAPDDTITRNINALGTLGCGVDLDDFGTGHASIASIRRFSVSRIKIDRSFVIKADRDPEQQRMISAILTMAERLGVETLAEGVETVGEHVLLAQLGCDHVQGFGIARPMPFADVGLDQAAQ
jgi:diguanylate cyclase (GGDEF)-like protein